MVATGLIVVDVQTDFCEGGALAVGGGAGVAAQISVYLAAMVATYDLVVATRDVHIDPGDHFAAAGTPPDFVETWPAHCVAGTAGADYHPALSLPAGTVHVVKGAFAAAYSGFEARTPDDRHAGPADLLRAAGVTDIHVVGIAESHCVRATALDAVREGFVVDVLSDLTVGVSPETTEAARRDMVAAGVRLRPSGPLTG